MSLRAPILSNQRLTLKTHFNHLFKVLSLNVVVLGAKVSTCECGGGGGNIQSMERVLSAHCSGREHTTLKQTIGCAVPPVV